MICDTAVTLCQLKEEFTKQYAGHAHIQEIIPSTSSKKFPLTTTHLDILHSFAKSNPIYYNEYRTNISGIECIVYEGDINQYWLDSTKHGSSCQPFYPTWIVSAYLMASLAESLGYTEIIDVGSGDGRIAFCASVLGLKPHSIEIDQGLVELQDTISNITKRDFGALCTDALEFDYDLELEKPIFFIGGLPQMGGDILADDLLSKVHDEGIQDVGIVFAGTMSKRALSANNKDGGWSPLITKHDLKVQATLVLPTVWTFDQTWDTPYIYTSLKPHQKNNRHL